jgi:hypothetical protein
LRSGLDDGLQEPHVHRPAGTHRVAAAAAEDGPGPHAADGREGRRLAGEGLVGQALVQRVERDLLDLARGVAHAQL